MQVPLEISYRNIEKTDYIESLVREKAAELDRVHSHITSCHVAVEKPQSHQQQGNPFRVRIDVRVPPGHELVVKQKPTGGEMHRELSAVIRKAFSAMKRRLKKLEEQQRRDVKSHPEQTENQGIVKKLFPEHGYGFLRTLNNREVYFHKNSVLHNGFEDLEEGTLVRYVGEMGNNGPQASTVQIVDNQG
mgnify:CR=1 FL=1